MYDRNNAVDWLTLFRLLSSERWHPFYAEMWLPEELVRNPQYLTHHFARDFMKAYYSKAALEMGGSKAGIIFMNTHLENLLNKLRKAYNEETCDLFLIWCDKYFARDPSGLPSRLQLRDFFWSICVGPKGSGPEPNIGLFLFDNSTMQIICDTTKQYIKSSLDDELKDRIELEMDPPRTEWEEWVHESFILGLGKDGINNWEYYKKAWDPVADESRTVQFIIQINQGISIIKDLTEKISADDMEKLVEWARQGLVERGAPENSIYLNWYKQFNW